MKLLLHVCCAPCSVYCIEQLKKEKIEPVLYWYNPNIHPFKEYEMRRETLVNYAKTVGVNVVVEDEYGLDEFCKSVSEDIDHRCTAYCYPVRLRKTFEYAKNNGFDTVSTTLLYSIYQNHDFIKMYCQRLSEEYSIAFLYRDFRVGFWEGHDKAAEAGLYMQKYCGCIFSEEDRYLKKLNSKPSLPEEFEFNRKNSLQIKKEKNDEVDVYSFVKDNQTLCTAIFAEFDNKTIELKRILIDDKVREKGLEERLINRALSNYKQKYSQALVFACAKDIPFFVKIGFDCFSEIKNSKDEQQLICYLRKL